MTRSRLFMLTGALVAVIATAIPAEAQNRRGGSAGPGRAAPRGPIAGGPARPRPGPGPGRPAPYYTPRYYRPGFSLDFYSGYPYGYYYGRPWGYPYYSYGRPYAYPSYEYGIGARAAAGGVRIDVQQKGAEVYVDGYYAGTVADFDGTFQSLDLEPGAHHIELRAQGYETATFDVNIAAGRTITYRSELRPLQP